jgi:hypothetical protein
MLKNKTNWNQHADKIQRDRLPKLLKNYKPHWIKEPRITLKETFE